MHTIGNLFKVFIKTEIFQAFALSLICFSFKNFKINIVLYYKYIDKMNSIPT